MPRWLNTLGNTTLSIAICARCKMKRAYDDLVMDTNYPGLRVCVYGCVDQKDPYRLPARQTERINLRYARPDENVETSQTILTVNNNGDIQETPGIPPSISVSE